MTGFVALLKVFFSLSFFLPLNVFLIFSKKKKKGLIELKAVPIVDRSEKLADFEQILLAKQQQHELLFSKIDEYFGIKQQQEQQQHKGLFVVPVDVTARLICLIPAFSQNVTPQKSVISPNEGVTVYHISGHFQIFYEVVLGVLWWVLGEERGKGFGYKERKEFGEWVGVVEREVEREVKKRGKKEGKGGKRGRLEKLRGALLFGGEGGGIPFDSPNGSSFFEATNMIELERKVEEGRGGGEGERGEGGWKGGDYLGVGYVEKFVKVLVGLGEGEKE